MPSKRANVKNEKQYEALKDKGMSKERAAKIANSPEASKHGGEKSHSGCGKPSRVGPPRRRKRPAARAARHSAEELTQKQAAKRPFRGLREAESAPVDSASAGTEGAGKPLSCR